MIHALELPWGMADECKEAYDLKMIKGGLALYGQPLLPKVLEPYASRDFSYARWVEDERNATVIPPAREGVKRAKLTEEQEALAGRIAETYTSGGRGFLWASEVGEAKRLAILGGVAACARLSAQEKPEGRTLLVVCPKGLEAVWRHTLRSYPLVTSFLRVLVLNYSQLSRLLAAPPQARLTTKGAAKRNQTAKHGVPTIAWDFVVFDESQRLHGYPRSKEALEAVAVASLGKPYAKGSTPFVVFSPSLLGESPLGFAAYASLLAPTMDATAKDVRPEGWSEFLQHQGFAVVDTRYGYRWKPLERRLKSATAQEIKELATARKRDTVKLLRTLRDAPDVATHKLSVDFWEPLALEVAPGVLRDALRLQEDLREASRRGRLAGTEGDALAHTHGVHLDDLRVHAFLEVIFHLRESDRPLALVFSHEGTLETALERLEKKKVATAIGWGQEREEALLAFYRGDVPVLLWLQDGVRASMAPPKDFNYLLVPLNWRSGIHGEALRNTLGHDAPRVLLPYLQEVGERALVEQLVSLGELPEKTVLRAAKTQAAQRGR